MVSEVQKRVRLLRELKRWIDSTRESEEAANAVIAEVERDNGDTAGGGGGEEEEMNENQREMERSIEGENEEGL